MAYTTIPKSTDYFTPKLYTGNNGASLTISGLNFQPDLTWIKARNATETHGLYDIIRGALYRLQSNSSNASTSTTGTVTGWTSDGFSLGTSDEVNGTYNYASWNWKANGAGSTNTDGSINTTYTSANTTSGFSISKFVGTGSNATVGHGLGVAPKMIIVKSLVSGNWSVYHASLGGTKAIFMDLTGGAATHIDYWNNTDPTSSVFSIGTSSNMNHSGQDMIAYCFAEVQGYSKIGSYIGNGSATAPPFIYLGFKPAFVLLKNTTQADSWFLHDSKRDGFNDDNEYLRPNLTDGDSSGINRIRLLSNGFSVPTTDKSHNVNGNNYIYMAFAEEPLVSTNGIPATAR
jgi:hypothetical protein